MKRFFYVKKKLDFNTNCFLKKYVQKSGLIFFQSILEKDFSVFNTDDFTSIPSLTKASKLSHYYNTMFLDKNK